MQAINKRIPDFINEHHVLTLATCVNNEPYCANLFYAYLEKENLLVFVSEASTRHITEGCTNDVVAAAITLETETIGVVRGLQIQGKLMRPQGALLRKARHRYIKRFPYAVLARTPLWALRPCFFKLTDNRLGFGKKIIVDNRLEG